MSRLVLSPAVRDDLVAHAREGAPDEVCGVLGGEHGDRESRVETARPTGNAAADPRREYTLDPEEQFEAMRAIEAADRDVVGFYHSHPRGPAEPSATDRARATWPGHSYVIVVLSGAEPTVGSWRWTGEAFERETVVVEE